MATVEQSLYNIAVALEGILEELKTLNDSKLAVQETRDYDNSSMD